MKNLITNFVVNENGSTSTKAALAIAVTLMATQVFAGCCVNGVGPCCIR